MIHRLGVAIAVALLLASCGDDGGRYDARVDAVREAVDAGDRDAALASLDELAADALRAHAEGDVTEEELTQLTGLVDQARAQLADQLPAATPTAEAPAATAPPAPAPAVDESDGGEGKEDKGDERKGRGGDDGDDDDDD